MPKAILLAPIDALTNAAINEKTAELLMQGRSLTKPAIVMEIIREWHELRKERQIGVVLTGKVAQRTKASV